MQAALESPLLQLLAVLALVAANGMFVAAEFAIVSVRRTRLLPLAQRGSAVAKRVLQAAADPNAFLAATQLGITMASLGLGWIGEPAVARWIEPWLDALPETIRGTSAHVIAGVLAFTFITTLHIVFGELAAKSAALWRPEETALLVAPPTELFHSIFRPFIWLLNSAANGVLGLFGLRAPSGHHVFSSEEIGTLVTESQRAGAMEEQEALFVHRVLKFADRMADEVMVPRVRIEGLPEESSIKDAIAIVRRSGYTRFPVYAEESLDHIVGMTHVKDLLAALDDGRDGAPVGSIMRPVLYVPEMKPILDLLDEMRGRGTQLAVVLDEYGGTEGMVTLEDLLEELVGEIPGEFRKERPLVVARQADRITVDAAISLEDLGGLLQTEFSSEEANTLGGLIYHLAGEVPQAGAIVHHGNWEIKVQSVSGNRIDLVQLRKLGRG